MVKRGGEVMKWIFPEESLKRSCPLRNRPKQKSPEDKVYDDVRSSIPDTPGTRRKEYDFYNNGGEQIINDEKEESRSIRRNRT
jgi:hypothetical protein